MLRKSKPIIGNVLMLRVLVEIRSLKKVATSVISMILVVADYTLQLVLHQLRNSDMSELTGDWLN